MATQRRIPEGSIPLEVQTFSSKRLWAFILLFAALTLVSLLFMVTQLDAQYVRTEDYTTRLSWVLFLAMTLAALYIQRRGGVKIEIYDHGLALITHIRKPFYWAWDDYGPLTLSTDVVRSIRNAFMMTTLVRLCADPVVHNAPASDAIRMSLTGFPAGADEATAETFLGRINAARSRNLATPDG